MALAKFRDQGCGPVSHVGGPSGDEIFFTEQDLLVVAKISMEPAVNVIEHHELFRSEGLVGHAMPMYDICSDGRRIILLDPVPTEEPLLLGAQEWYEDFRDRDQK